MPRSCRLGAQVPATVKNGSVGDGLRLMPGFALHGRFWGQPRRFVALVIAIVLLAVLASFSSS
jgi:hypothetical protein